MEQRTCYCINLAMRPDRWEKVQEEFKKMGPNYKLERFNAVRHYPAKIGLVKSWVKLVQMAKRKGLKELFIIEDDLLLCNNAAKIFEETYKELPEDWDLFSGGFYWLGNNFQIVKPGLAKVGDFSSTHFLLIRDTMYDTILKAHEDYVNEETVPGNIDRYLGYKSLKGELNIYVAWPMFAKQEDGYSNILSKETNYNTVEYYRKNNMVFIE